MEVQEHHEDIIGGISNQLKEIMDKSDQAIYIYLDDAHKVCNQKHATMLGYSSPEEWARTTDLTSAGVAEKSQKAVVEAYQRTMDKMAGSSLKITLKQKSGKTINTNMIMVPIAYQGHKLAMHFIQP